jgi:basic membrane protein A and related proteins
MRKAMVGVVIALAVASVSACGSSDESSNGASAGTAVTSAKELRVALITDIGGVNDKSLNELAARGIKQAGKELGVQYTIAESSSDADYRPNLTKYAQQGYDLVIGAGFLMGKALGEVAQQYPKTRFAILDFSAKDPAINGARNVLGVLFRTEEAGYLAGQLAGLVQQEKGLEGVNGAKTLGTIGGLKVPAVDSYVAGFRAGLKAIEPTARVLHAYSNSFSDQQACAELARSQMSAGASIVFPIAGGCGLGALDAVEQKGRWAIGVDFDQSYRGAYILTSAVKHVDRAVVAVVKSVQDGTYAGGEDIVLGLKEDGVGLSGTSSQVPASAIKRVDAVRQQIIDGKITVPNTLDK